METEETFEVQQEITKRVTIKFPCFLQCYQQYIYLKREGKSYIETKIVLKDDMFFAVQFKWSAIESLKEYASKEWIESDEETFFKALVMAEDCMRAFKDELTLKEAVAMNQDLKVK